MAKINATCQMCGGVFPVSEMHGAPSIHRNGAPAYVCERCESTNHGYHAMPGTVTGSSAVMGNEKVNHKMVGIENETAFTDETARLVLFEYGFIATHDCSLDSEGEGSRYRSPYGSDRNTCEYVSPVFNGLNRPSKWALTMDKLISEGHMIINESCGTHFHVSIDSMKNENGEKVYMDMIRRFYNSLFVPLCDDMKANPEKTAEIFGRYFTGYAKSINMNTTQKEHNDRYYFINCMANNNIEFRLNKFTSGRQYQKLMKMEVKMVETIINNFCKKFNDKGERNTAEATAYRKACAQKTAKKLVKIFHENF